MKQESNLIRCPKCDTKINVNELLYSQLQQQAEKEFEKKYSEVSKEKKEIEKMKVQLRESVEKGIDARLSVERLKIEKRLRDQINEEKSGELGSLHEQLKVKIQEAKELNRIKTDFLKLKREKEELRGKIELEMEEKLGKQLEDAKQKFLENAETKSDLKIAELENVISQLSKKLKEAQQKADQGSMQLQGEVAELALEKVFRNTYPNDEVKEVAKGANGSDILISVRDKQYRNPGIIAIECKRTKAFSASWIQKLKEDQRNHKADIAVLVTEVMPSDMLHFGLKDGVWICNFQEVHPLIFVLRDSLLKFYEIKCAGENKADKMSNLYDYLTSSEFNMQIQTIVESFTRLKANLDQEKKAMHKLWKEREKTIDLVGECTSEMFGSFRAIAGSSIKEIPSMGLPLLGEGENQV